MKAKLFAAHPLADDKAALRQALRRARIAIPQQQRRTAEQAANRSLKKLIKRGQRIAVYWPVGSEMRLDGFIRAARQRGAELYLPHIVKNQRRLWFTPYPAPSSLKATKPKPSSKRSGSLNIPQYGGRKIRADRLHLMLLPFIGIDARGIRLGQGGGFYDATLAACKNRHRPKTAAAGFACQAVARIPAEIHDQAADCFVCEHGIFRLSEKPSINKF